MAQTQIAGGKIGSIKNLKRSLTSSGGGPLSWIPKEGRTVRFLTEPDDWFGFYEHYDETIRKSYPCIEGDCPGCNTDQKRTFRYVANALDIETDKVIALQLPKSLANRLTARYERNDTLMDRDYELFKTGEKLDTEYDLNPEAPKRRAMNKYTLLDLGALLQEAWNLIWGDSDGDDEDEEETPRSTRNRKAAASSRTRRTAVAEDEDEDDEDDEDEAEEDDDDIDDDDDDESHADLPASLDELEDMSLAELKEIAEEIGVSVKPEKGKTRVSAALIRERIAEELGLDGDEDEEEDEFEEDDEADEEDDDDEEFEDFTDDELKSMSTNELREIARDFDINPTKMSKPDLIDAILEAQG